MSNNPCKHDCTSNCRRNGCNCECGEYHMNDKEYDEAMQERECAEFEWHWDKCEKCREYIYKKITEAIKIKYGK